jgi:DNA-binding response OmpR family regulator
VLEAAGYRVLLATDGMEGLAAYRQNRTAVALLLTDVVMPRMSGTALADSIRELDPELPVLFMSGTSNAADRGQGCLTKPFGSASLIARVNTVFSVPRQKAASTA